MYRIILPETLLYRTNFNYCMECLNCGQDKKAEMVVHKDDPTSSVAHICQRCKLQLLNAKQTPRSCAKCDNLAEFGTQELEKVESSSDPRGKGHIRLFDEYLLCEDHLNQMTA